MFTLNRVTGKPIFDIEERPVPKSDVPSEQTSPTQPFPVKPPPLTQNTVSRDNLYKGEPQHQSVLRAHGGRQQHEARRAVHADRRSTATAFRRRDRRAASTSGARPYDPKLHLFISNTTNMFQPMRLILRPDGSYVNAGPLAGTRRFGDPERKLLCGPTPWGELVAVNMDTGDIVYRKTLGVSDMLPRRHAGHGPSEFRRRDPHGERPDLRRRHRRFPVPRLCDRDRREALGDQAAVVDRNDADHLPWEPMDASSSPW